MAKVTVALLSLRSFFICWRSLVLIIQVDARVIICPRLPLRREAGSSSWVGHVLIALANTSDTCVFSVIFRACFSARFRLNDPNNNNRKNAQS